MTKKAKLTSNLPNIKNDSININLKNPYIKVNFFEIGITFFGLAL